jgi:RNA polymerase sigma factor (sigma-70 family)
MGELPDVASVTSLEEEAVPRLAISAAVAGLEDRDRELIALRYGADLSVRQIAVLLALRPNAVDVALHRARNRLAARLEDGEEDDASEIDTPAVRIGRRARY